MLPADLNDAQRARFAHEHPTDLDSGPSSPSSSAPTFYETRRRPKSARHRAHATDGSSSSSHLLAQLVSREEEVREINAALVVTTERLEAESSRANAAERRALDYFHRLRIATDNRERAEQESARLREELKLYKLQLENAQKEIFRAQDIIDQVSAQRNEAEAEATRARTKARKLQEEKTVMIAREEGRRMGYQEGLSMGRRIGYDEEGHHGEGDNVDELGEATTDEERNDPPPHVPSRSSASIRHHSLRSGSAQPLRTFETASPPPPLPVPSRVVPVRAHTPSHDHRAPSPPREIDDPETMQPIPIRPSPILPAQHISVPIDDGWIPTADSHTSYIRIPSPHQLQQPIPASPNSVRIELQDQRPIPEPEPTPVPPPVRSRSRAYQASAPPPVVPRGHTPSLASRASTNFSQCDLVNKRPGSSLRNEIYVGRARSGSQPSRENTSRNEHRDQERRLSSRTEAETIAEQWRADSDAESSPRNPPRSFTPAPIPHPHRPPNFYYRPRETATPAPRGDVDDPRARPPVPTGPTATRSQPPPGDPASNPARPRSSFDYLRRGPQRPASGGSIPNIVVESPSEPETVMSPSATTTAHPDLLSPEAANRPLPQDDPGQRQRHPSNPPPYSQSQSQSQFQAPPPPQPHRHHHHHQSTSYDAAPRSGTPHSAWPAGFVPYPPGYGTTSSSTSNSNSNRAKPSANAEKDHRRTYSNPVAPPYTSSTSSSHRHTSANANTEYVRPRTQSASASRAYAAHGSGDGNAYEASPVPPGVTYPAPPVRPHTSHQHYRDEWEREREREGARDKRREETREYERRRDKREQEPEDMGLYDEMSRSPAPLQRPISLFDSDE